MSTPKHPQEETAVVPAELHEQMLRRTTNRNAHMITAHGNVQLGRKGRTGKAGKGKKADVS